ncbi:uncharacterized protein MELLADRAFT_64272 [Melampsora larici-populina 98AG31]|uniref:Secreted protein n=1 Tax=Melampsora larici-populina (strain 98AG31 / pathotype 3-4-7) TaxID=747676 RepID=F4RQU4_MELLP|nr:uncharacterized protein MELLADRAFT_64272 [Melampsora larici-populina 98AG31]EGG05100.1 hypothetical protein MELLADRAFT_64272 [Melampsora larici-populina 98AG31]
MKKNILCLGWCLMFSYALCAPFLSQSGNEVEDWNPFMALGDYRIGHELQFERSNPSTELHRQEYTNMAREHSRLHRARLEREKGKNMLHERFKASEILGPLNEELEYKAHSSSVFSELVQRFVDLFTDAEKMRKLLALCKSAKTQSEGIKPIVRDLQKLVTEHQFEAYLFHRGSRFEYIVFTALEYLQGEDLNVYDRLWTLSILRILQSLLPRGYLEPIRQDPNTGRVCRGGLELFLTEGIDLVKDLSQGRKDSFTPDESVAEALKRVELISNIRNHLQDSQRGHQTPGFIAIHDKLLLTRSLSNGGVVESLALQALQHMNAKDTPDEEIHCLDLILNHLQKFYPAVREIIFSLPSTSKPSQVIQERFKCQAVLQPHIELYLEKGDIDPYIKSLLLPFLGRHSVNLDDVKNLLHSCNVHDSALQDLKVQSHGTDVTKEEQYHRDQDFFIDMMYKVSPYLEGLQDHLDSLVKKGCKPSHFYLTPKTTPHNTDYLSVILFFNKWLIEVFPEL